MTGDILVSLGSILEGREDVGVRSTFDSIDESGNLREEGVVVLSISLSQRRAGGHTVKECLSS